MTNQTKWNPYKVSLFLGTIALFIVFAILGVFEY